MYLRAEMISMGWKIIDTDFTVTHYNISVWESIVIEYEKRNLDVVKNLVRAVKTWPSNTPKGQLISVILLATHYIIEPYREELEKYLMLL